MRWSMALLNTKITFNIIIIFIIIPCLYEKYNIPSKIIFLYIYRKFEFTIRLDRAAKIMSEINRGLS